MSVENNEQIIVPPRVEVPGEESNSTAADLPKPSVYYANAYLIKGTLQETTFPASPYSYFSLSRKHGLREVWDEDHAKYYKNDTKHYISAYAKPLALYLSMGSNFVRIELGVGTAKIVDIDTFLLVKEPDFVVKALTYCLGFPIDMTKAVLFCNAMRVARLESELPNIPDFGSVDNFPLVGTQIFQKYKGMIVNAYTGSVTHGVSDKVRDDLGTDVSTDVPDGDSTGSDGTGDTGSAGSAGSTGSAETNTGAVGDGESADGQTVGGIDVIIDGVHNNNADSGSGSVDNTQDIPEDTEDAGQGVENDGNVQDSDAVSDVDSDSDTTGTNTDGSTGGVGEDSGDTEPEEPTEPDVPVIDPIIEPITETDTEKLARIMAMKPNLIIRMYMQQCSETLVFGDPFACDKEC